MPRTKRLPPARRAQEPTQDLARRGPESSSGETTPSGPLTRRSAERALQDRRKVGAGNHAPSDDNARTSYRRGAHESPQKQVDFGPA
jgi:hypothetical protein